MKIVQTYWSCHVATAEGLLQHMGGWRSSWLHIVSWALSSSLARRHYDTLELVTDQAGKTLLVDWLDLPYTQVWNVLDEHLDTCPAPLWALPKIIAYSLQDSPFLHIDGDVFLRRPLDKAYLKAPIVCQNIEAGFPIYAETMAQILPAFDGIPLAIRRTNGLFNASNTGVFGGNDLTFIRRYVTIALEFVRQNLDKLDQVNTTYFNCVFEQFLLNRLLNQQAVKARYLLPPVNHFDEYGQLAAFSADPHVPIRHLIGPFKWDVRLSEPMEKQLKTEFPATYRRLREVYSEVASLV